jgi:hypothetical protein
MPDRSTSGKTLCTSLDMDAGTPGTAAAAAPAPARQQPQLHLYDVILQDMRCLQSLCWELYELGLCGRNSTADPTAAVVVLCQKRRVDKLGLDSL